MSTTVDLDLDPDQLRLDGLIAWARQEASALEAILPAAIDAQWSLPPNPKPREDTTERAKNVRNEPTAAIALDGRRLALRLQVIRSEDAIRQAIVALRGVRLGLERSLSAWEGEPL